MSLSTGLLGFVIVLKKTKKYMLYSSIKTQKKKSRGAGEKAVSKTLAVLAEGHEFDP